MNDEDLTEEQLDKEIKRSKAVVEVSKAIIQNASLVLKAEKHFSEYEGRKSVKTLMLGDEEGEF